MKFHTATLFTAAAAIAPLVSADCFDTPSTSSCADFAYPPAQAFSELDALCKGAPWFASCAISRLAICKATPPPSYCEATPLILSGCTDPILKKLNGSAVSACSKVMSLCGSGSVVKACTSGTLKALPASDVIASKVSSTCYEMPMMADCSKCAGTPSPSGAWETCPDVFVAYGSLCQDMPGMTQCKEINTFCNSTKIAGVCVPAPKDVPASSPTPKPNVATERSISTLLFIGSVVFSALNL